jgi:hypothetical protein
MSSRYWRALAFSSSHTGQWAIEDLPWKTPDGWESDYWNLYLLRIVTADPERVTVSLEEQQRVARLSRVLEELAQRSRILRRPVEVELRDGNRVTDPALRLHERGATSILLEPEADLGEPKGPCGEWFVYDLAPQVLKLGGRLLQATYDRETRERLIKVVDATWTHLRGRRLEPTMLRQYDSHGWDALANPSPSSDMAEREHAPGDISSWYITERVVEGLVAVEEANQLRVLGGTATSSVAEELIAELRWLAFNRRETQKSREQLLWQIAQAEEAAAASPALGLAAALAVAQQLEAQRTGP